MKRLYLYPLFILLTSCSGYKELSFSCTGHQEERVTILGKHSTKSTPKVVGIYITESTRTPINFWRDKTQIASIDGMIFLTNQFSIQDFAIIGGVDDEKDGFNNEMIRGFVFDRKTNILTINKTVSNLHREEYIRFEGVCSPVIK